MEPVVVTGGGDRHKEQPLSLRLGDLRERTEALAVSAGVPLRRYILDAVREKLDRDEKQARDEWARVKRELDRMPPEAWRQLRALADALAPE